MNSFILTKNYNIIYQNEWNWRSKKKTTGIIINKFLLIINNLKEIRNRANKKVETSESESNVDTQEGEKEKILKFRNYQPYDNSLVSKGTIPENSRTLIEEVNSHYTKVDVIKQELENFKDNEELNIAPKKINWVK